MVQLNCELFTIRAISADAGSQTISKKTMKKILIIEDDLVLLQMITKALRLNGFETIEAENGRAGVQLANIYVPDLVLSDVKMQGFDGFATLAALRYQPRTEAIPVVLMTGNPDESGRGFAMELGAADYITKPFTVPGLVASIKAQIRESGSVGLAALGAGSAEGPIELGATDEQEKVRASRHDQMVASALATPLDIACFATGRSPGAASGHSHDPAHEAESMVAAQLRMLNRFHPNLGNTAMRAVILCRAQAEVLSLSPEDSRNLCWAAALHDISLVGLDQEAVGRWLRDPRKVTEEEQAFIRNHPIESQLMLEDSPVLKTAGWIIRSHHENWDGTGYPDTLKHENIPLLARLLAVAVCYCSQHTLDQRAVRMVESVRGSIFDPKAVKALVDAVAIAKVPRGVREVLLNEVKPNQILAHGIRNVMGVVLAPKDRQMSASLIQKINAINRVSPLDQHVLVYC